MHSFLRLNFRRSFFKPFLRYYSNEFVSAKSCAPETLSVRQKAWKEAQEKYANFSPQIIYSSLVENPFVEYRHENKSQPSIENFPSNWMDDYEFYEGSLDDEGNINSKHGTADPNIKPSHVPCNGCGAHLHCSSVSVPGFIPKEIFMGRTVKELKTIVCQRCHFLKNYNIALDVEVSADSYVQTLSTIQDKFALAIVIVDLLDFPCSIWPGMQQLLGSKRPIFIVGNKVDLLPRDSKGYLERVKICLATQIRSSGFDNLNIKYISLISAKTGYGIEELITQLYKIWKYKGDVYLMGCTNVGKSSLFNILLNSDYCRPGATDLIRKATTCPWPGTTLHMLRFPILRPSDIRIHNRFQRLFSERHRKAAEEQLRKDQAKATGSIRAAQLIGKVGQTFKSSEEVTDAFSMSAGTDPIITLNERGKEYKEAKWCYDTPGVLHPDQITDLLTTEELLAVQPKEMIRPRAFRFSAGMSIFLGGLARLDFLQYENQKQQDSVRIYVFSSMRIPIVISNTEHATELYNKYLGTKLFGLPCGSEERMTRWPGLTANDVDINIVGVNSFKEGLDCDIVLSSVGWIGMEVPRNATATFRAWTPHASGIHLRRPPLIPFADRLIGKRIRYSLAYNSSKPFVFNK